jgi:Lon protease-like protein
MSEIGLFPLPLVLLPTEQVPLHVFEERYKELIGECVADGREFGFVYADDDGLREVGTRAGVTEVLARFDDGRMNVLVEGRERFRLLALTTGRSFQTGDVEPIEDEEDTPSGDAVERALELFERLRELTASDVEMPSGDPRRQLSYALAARVELAPQVKQELLQEGSERIRLDRVCDLLADAATSVELQRSAAERAASNGKVELG